MLFNRLRPEKLAVPAAMSFVVIGLMMIATAVAFPRLASLHAHFSRETLDFFQGLLFGLAIACELIGLSALIPALSAARRNDQDGTARQ